MLLPHLSGVLVERIERTAAGLAIWRRVKAAAGTCPSCGSRSSRIYSRYDRRLAESAVASQPVQLLLQVHRFFRDSQNCPVTTFAEQINGLTSKHARPDGARLGHGWGLSSAGTRCCAWCRHSPRAGRVLAGSSGFLTR